MFTCPKASNKALKMPMLKSNAKPWVLGEKAGHQGGKTIYIPPKVEVGHKRIDAKWKETTRDLPCLLFELSSLF